MNIIATLNPLYKDLLTIGYANFVADTDFNRLTNRLGVTDIYAEAHNEAQKKENNPYDWLGIANTNNEDLLGHFLNKLYEKPFEEFTETITTLLEASIPLLNYIPDVNDIISDFESIGITKEYQNRVIKVWQQVDLNYTKKVSYFYDLVLNRAINNSVNDNHYFLLRADFLQHYALKKHIPDYITNHVQIQGFWQFIKGRGGYRDRESFIVDTFEPLLKASQTILNVAHDNILTTVHQNIDMNYISQDWRKALNRLKDDPEAAITSARTLTETVCKYILDSSSIDFDDGIDLLKLYRLTAKQLNLSPEAHTEQVFKQILTGCVSIVEGLGTLRNKHSDAHGKKITNIRPSARHAELAVNISGALCSFLLQTFEFRQLKPSRSAEANAAS